MIADFKYSVDKLVNLFKEDINDYEDDLSIELIYYFINCVMAFTFEENENEAIMELYEWLKNKYPYKPTDEDKDDEFDYEDYDDNYGDDFIPIDIQELKKVKEDINIYIDKNDGQVILFLKEKRLNTFLNENNQEY
ncbi:SAP domain family protein [Salmonella enterica subsp. enterica serovar Paratyphi A]|nr:SAP domain family protein [Salmonella enterica subsp. enterica serovar Paratyphi A]